MTSAEPPTHTDSASPAVVDNCPPADSASSQFHQAVIDTENTIGIDDVDIPTTNDIGQPDDDDAAVARTGTGNDDDAQLPPEYQLYQIDPTNNPNLDPLEYTFRKFIPIPRVYYWDTASPLNNYHQQLPMKIKLWHRSIYYLGEGLRKAEAGGEIIANILGLNDGPFEFVTKNVTEEELARSREMLEMRNREAERRREGDV
ncbi:hypothetical protein ACHAWU_004684 [Discostella pseudostelligera]|uniref:Uncharacterized protein n=1 Tax=Discostella pseudostelligera TaxID=259834 RepID=A0ABD3N9H6_9STRA